MSLQQPNIEVSDRPVPPAGINGLPDETLSRIFSIATQLTLVHNDVSGWSDDYDNPGEWLPYRPSGNKPIAQLVA